MTYRRVTQGFLAILAFALAASACSGDEGTQPPAGSAGDGGEAGDGAGGAQAGSGGEAGGDPEAGSGGEAGGAQAGSGGEAGAQGSSCTALALDRPAFYFNTFGQLGGLRYTVQGQLGAADLSDYVLVELYDSTTPAGDGFLPPLEPGDFDLTSPPNDALATCQHCVSLLIDVIEGVDEFGFAFFQPTEWYFQTSGELTLDEVHDPLGEFVEDTVMLGSVSGVRLSPVDFADPATPFLDGDCYSLDEASFDTRPTPGQDCEDVVDCGNELLEVCDPATLSCVDEIQCHIDLPCETDAFCIQQSPLSPLGACYLRCEPFSSGGCPDGQTCVQYGLSEGDGYCLTGGDGALGEACESKAAVTSCADEAVCVETCVAQCGYFSGDPECADGSACDVLGHCVAPEAGDPAALGETCRAGAELAAGCAQNQNRFDGFCFGYDPAERYLCSKSCFVDADDYDGDADDGASDADCAAAEFCALRFSSGLGVCLPDPICGDGEFGEVGESCDDGNSVSGDGCSADCQSVEYDVLCETAVTLPPNGEVEGTSAGGLDGFLSDCQAGIARGRLYTVTPPGPGQLRLLLTSPTRQLVALRTDCEDPDSELDCGESFPEGAGEASLLFQITQEDPTPITVVVTASTVLDEGPFTLSSAFTPEECGDSLVVGTEVCDDGNTASGDGCSADCASIEYDFFCENAETLPLDTPVAGNIAGAVFLFEPSCGYGPGADRLYQLTAPSDGILTVTLNQEIDGIYNDLSLFLLDPCGEPDVATELGCSSVVYPEEEVIVEVTEGQTVVVGVDGLFATEGEYEITATLE